MSNFTALIAVTPIEGVLSEFPYFFSTSKTPITASKKGAIIATLVISFDKVKLLGDKIVLQGKKMKLVSISEKEVIAFLTQDYTSFTCVELKAIWKERELKGFSTKTKEQLIEGIKIPIDQ